MARHSAIIGGSNAGRLLNCPASHQAILALPPSVQVTSEYAEEGTAMHAVMDALMRARRQGLRTEELSGVARSWVTRKFHDRALTDEHVATMIAPALACLAELEQIHGGDFGVVGVEQRVRFPGIPDAFGTVDLLLQNATHLLHIDWKFGSGVGVAAVYSDGEGAVVNPQLMYYTAAAWKSLNHLYFGGRKPVVAIVQPRGAEPLTFTEVTRRELQYFIKDVHNAVGAAIGRDPPRVRGEWCRFAPCKTACPLWTGPLLELAALMPKKPDAPAPQVTPYGHYLAQAKALIDSLVMLKNTIDEQMHSYLEQGGKIPGWRLKAKAKQRQWIGEDTVVPALRALGFTDAEIYQRKLATFQAADATAKRRGVEIPDALRVAPPSTETTLATTDDPAPIVEPHQLMQQFSAALLQLQQQAR